MTKTPTTLDDLFTEEEEAAAKRPAPAPMPPEELARRMDEFQRLMDEAPPETDDEDEDEDEEEA